jgi:hypothetical protein
MVKAEAFALGANDYLVKLPDRLEVVARIRYHSRGYIALLERNEAFVALQASRQVLANDLATAAHYVRSLLPPPQRIGPIDADWRFIPSAELGGDAFGYHSLDEDHIAIYLLDVCGHGVGAALLSVSALNSIRSEALPQTNFHDPGAVLAALNLAYQLAEHGPAKADEPPRVVLLTPGPYNETYFEHALLARYLGFALVEGDLCDEPLLADLFARHRFDAVIHLAAWAGVLGAPAMLPRSAFGVSPVTHAAGMP